MMTDFRLAILFVAFLGGSFVGCASTAELKSQLELLNKEVADLSAAQQRLQARLEEQQLHLTLLKQKVGEIPARSAAEAARTRLDAGGTRTAHASPSWPKAPGRNFTAGANSASVADQAPVLLNNRSISRQGISPEQDFMNAFSLYRANDLERAVPALEDFVRRYPENEFAAQAIFYSAKARFLLGDLKQAERQLLALVRRHPRSDQAAEALLLAGGCQEKQGKTKKARGTYLQLVDAYPLSEQANEANKRLQSIR